MIGTETEGLRNKQTIGDYPNYRIIKIGQNTEKRLRDLKRLAVTQTPDRIYCLAHVGKTQKEVNNDNKVNGYWGQKIKDISQEGVWICLRSGKLLIVG